MSEGYESSESELDPTQERLFLIKELQSVFAEHSDIARIRWGAVSMVAKLTGHAAIRYDEANEASIEPLLITNIITIQHGALARIAIGQPYMPATYAIPLETIPKELNANTADTDDYLRDILRHADFRDSAWSVRPGQCEIEKSVRPSWIYQEYPKLLNFRAFHRHLLAKERRQKKEPPSDG